MTDLTLPNICSVIFSFPDYMLVFSTEKCLSHYCSKIIRENGLCLNKNQNGFNILYIYLFPTEVSEQLL
jgi:hypothetical protein